MSPIRLEAPDAHGPGGAALAWTWFCAMAPSGSLYAGLLFGAGVSAWRFVYRRDRAARALGNDTILPACGGSMPKAGRIEALFVAELVGFPLSWTGLASSTPGATPGKDTPKSVA